MIIGIRNHEARCHIRSPVLSRAVSDAGRFRYVKPNHLQTKKNIASRVQRQLKLNNLVLVCGVQLDYATDRRKTKIAAFLENVGVSARMS